MEYKLYHGSSPYLSLEAVHIYIDRKKNINPKVEISILQGDSLDPQILVDQISSKNLFSSSRIIFLKRVYRNKKKDVFLDNILATLKNDNSTDTIIFWEDQKVKSNTKYYKFFKQSNDIEELDSLNKRTFFTWLKEELKRNSLKIEADAQKELAERTNYDPERCSNEIKKFILNDKDKMITKDDVNQLVTDTLEKDIWGLIDAINNQNKEISMSIIEKLKLQAVDPNYTISMLARNLRLITLTKFLVNQGKSYRDISVILRIPPFTTPSLIKASKEYTEERIKMLYTKLSNLDFQIKKGLVDGDLGLTLITPYL